MSRPGQPLLHVSAKSSSNPSTILAGLTLVLDLADVVVSSGKVATFNNNGGTPITQADTTKQAAYSAADVQFNGQPVAAFASNGSAGTVYNIYNLPSLAALTQGEVFAVLASQYGFVPGPGGGDRYSGLWRFGSTTENIHYPYPDGNVYDAFGTTARKTYTGVYLSHDLTAPHIYNVSSAPGAYTARFNSTQMFTTASNTVGFASAPTFGAHNGSALYAFNGRLAYLAVCSQVQTTQARADMRSYLSSRFGIAV